VCKWRGGVKKMNIGTYKINNKYKNIILFTNLIITYVSILYLFIRAYFDYCSSYNFRALIIRLHIQQHTIRYIHSYDA